MFGKATERGSPEAFLSWASMRAHPDLGPLPPLPDDLEAAVQHVWLMGPVCAADRASRFETLRAVSCALEPLSGVLCMQNSDGADRIARAMMLNVMRRTEPDATLADVGDRRYCVHLGLLCAILDALRWPHRRLAADMAHGFHTVGDVPDTGVWRPIESPASMPMQNFAESNHAWTYACQRRVLAAARSNPEMAQACWDRTLQEASDGLIDGPFTLSQLNERASSGYPAFGFGKFRPLPRFAIWQGTKYRCIDDAAASRTNSDGTSLHETITCDRPDMPLRVGQRFLELGPPLCALWLPVRMGAGMTVAAPMSLSAFSPWPMARRGYCGSLLMRRLLSSSWAWVRKSRASFGRSVLLPDSPARVGLPLLQSSLRRALSWSIPWGVPMASNSRRTSGVSAPSACRSKCDSAENTHPGGQRPCAPAAAPPERMVGPTFRALAGARWWQPSDLLYEGVEVFRAVCGRRDRGRRDVGRGDRAPVREQAACEAASERRPLVAEWNPCLADPLNHLYVGLGDECLDARDELVHGAEAGDEHPQEGVRDRRDDARAGEGLVLCARRMARRRRWLSRRRPCPVRGLLCLLPGLRAEGPLHRRALPEGRSHCGPPRQSRHRP